MFICIKQYLSKIWGPIYEKFKQYQGWMKKRGIAYKKEHVGYVKCIVWIMSKLK